MNGSRVLLVTGAAGGTGTALVDRFLASSGAAFVAGQTINVDSGTAKHCGWGAPTRTR
jgi:NADP-dependent 3-hydroxy acid dehydrogenase YdfG